MATEFPRNDDGTAAAMADPQIGDRFTEMGTFWIYVVAREGARLWTVEANSPCQLPRDGKLREMNVCDFRQRFRYAKLPGYWARLCGRGHDVAGWRTILEKGDRAMSNPWLLPTGQTIWMDGKAIEPEAEIKALRAALREILAVYEGQWCGFGLTKSGMAWRKRAIAAERRAKLALEGQ